jgi:hypothetical protein
VPAQHSWQALLQQHMQEQQALLQTRQQQPVAPQQVYLTTPAASSPPKACRGLPPGFDACKTPRIHLEGISTAAAAPEELQLVQQRLPWLRVPKPDTPPLSVGQQTVCPQPQQQYTPLLEQPRLAQQGGTTKYRTLQQQPVLAHAPARCGKARCRSKHAVAARPQQQLRQQQQAQTGLLTPGLRDCLDVLCLRPPQPRGRCTPGFHG